MKTELELQKEFIENPELKELREERERVLCNQENMNMNHIMPPAPPSDAEASMDKQRDFAESTLKPPSPPAILESSVPWSKVQIESENDEEDQQETVEENATVSFMNDGVRSNGGISTGPVDLEALD